MNAQSGISNRIAAIVVGAMVSLGLTSAPALAAPILLTDSAGQLIGADGVLIDGSLFDVRFVDGTCVDLFGGCDEESDFAFGGNPSGAEAAANALLNLVFQDVAAGDFDSDPTLTNGCSFAQCSVFIPFAVDTAASLVIVSQAINAMFSNAVDASGPLSTFADTTPNTNTVFAVFQPSAPPAVIPLPGAAWLFLSAAFGLWGVRRRRLAQHA